MMGNLDTTRLRPHPAATSRHGGMAQLIERRITDARNEGDKRAFTSPVLGRLLLVVVSRRAFQPGIVNSRSTSSLNWQRCLKRLLLEITTTSIHPSPELPTRTSTVFSANGTPL